MIKIVKIYSSIHHLFHRLFSINLPGLGFLFRRIKNDFVFEIKGKKMLFNHKIADNYGRLLNGNFNEPETHLFLDRVFNNSINDYFHFVDIGANIGEFVLDYSDHKKIQQLTVFEPQPEQIKVIENTISLNNFSKTKLIKKPVSNFSDEILFNFSETNSTASGITIDKNLGTLIKATTIDEVFQERQNTSYVFLIDTEGAELNILKGGKNFIKDNSPLIIFEYNHVTEKHFKIKDVQDELGLNYRIFKLNKRGELENRFENIWNLVAVPRNKFQYLIK
jgi:FkbM family methyltransferase